MAHAAGGRSSPTPLPPLAPTGLELQIQDIFGSDADSTLSLGKEEVQNKVSGLFEALKELRKSVEASPSGAITPYAACSCANKRRLMTFRLVRLVRLAQTTST